MTSRLSKQHLTTLHANVLKEELNQLNNLNIFNIINLLDSHVSILQQRPHFLHFFLKVLCSFFASVLFFRLLQLDDALSRPTADKQSLSAAFLIGSKSLRR